MVVLWRCGGAADGAVHHGGLEPIHAKLRADVDDTGAREPLQDADEAPEDVSLPHAIAEDGAANVHVLLIAVEAYVKSLALAHKSSHNAVDRLIHLNDSRRIHTYHSSCFMLARSALFFKKNLKDLSYSQDLYLLGALLARDFQLDMIVWN